MEAPEILSNGRSERVRIRLDPLSRIKLEEMAASSNMTLGEYLRWVVNRFLPPVTIKEGR